MRSVFLIGGSLAGMFFGEIYPAIILALILHNLGTKLNTGIQITKSTRYKLIKAAIQIMIAISKADGVFTKNELNYIKNFLSYYFKVDESEFSWYLNYMKKETYKKNVSLNASFNTIKNNSHKHEKVFFMHCFSELALTSSPIKIRQRQIISAFAKHLGISTNKANHTWRKFIAKPQEHYEILEANPVMSINDIRKKYIEMAKFYHPDRYRHRTLSEQKFANEKMQRLQVVGEGQT